MNFNWWHVEIELNDLKVHVKGEIIGRVELNPEVDSSIQQVTLWQNFISIRMLLGKCWHN